MGFGGTNSLSGNNAPASFQAPSGTQMGQMGEGGGSNFYMGDEGYQEEEQQDQRENPDLVLVDQGKEEDRNQNRQFLENIITGSGRSWFNPWEVPASQRSSETLQAEHHEIEIANAPRPQANSKRKKMFIINA